ncbi:unnamed protein product [Parajaminaea phylloscopi]
MSIMASQRASWEQGTAQTAWTEYDAGRWTVFAGAGTGPPYRPGHIREQSTGVPMAVLSMAYHSVSSQDRLGKLASSVTGDENATQGSSLDSASAGESVLLGAFLADEINSSTGFWIGAAQRQLDYVLNETPRMANGAISHRTSQRQLWSDAIYMMPPFLASYGLYTSNQTLLQAAYDQIRLYRDGLRLTSGTGQGMWGHILTTRHGALHWQDGSAWATGEGWVAGGILRTLAAIAQSPFSSQMNSQKQDLVAWTKEILDAAYPFLDPSTSLFRNHINDTSSFPDTAGSAFLAYAAFRLASMVQGDDAHIRDAERIHSAVQDQVSRIGTLMSPVVNALSFTSEGETSPESLSFILLLEAARRDYHAGNVTGLDGPGSGSRPAANTATQLLRVPSSTLFAVASALAIGFAAFPLI